MIVFNNKEHGFTIAKAIPRIFDPAADQVISRVDKGGRLLGGVIYEGMISNCIFMHQAGFDKRWMMGDMLWVLFDYPFNQLKLGMVCGTIPSSKPELLDFNLRLGFKIECSIKGAYVDGDLIVMAMRRDECRWLKLQPRTLVGVEVLENTP
jgi:hypothetical protein